MKTIIGVCVVAVLAIVGVFVMAVNTNPSPRVKSEDSEPYLVVEHDGVRLWAVDRWVGGEGRRTIYFTNKATRVEWNRPSGKAIRKEQNAGEE